MKKLITLVSALLLPLSATLDAQTAGHPRIEVGPNIRVSTGSGVHIEPMIAASPIDAKTLIAVATELHDGDTSYLASYTSHDGGRSWKRSELPLDCCGDPQIAFGPTGVAYFAALGARRKGDRDPDDWSMLGLFIAKSDDAGATWQRPVQADGDYVDHPQLVVDRSGGAFNGRGYVSGQLGMIGDALALYRTEDAGKSWSNWTAVDHVTLYFTSTNPLVLSDGTLWVSVHQWTAGYNAAHADSATDAFALSTDGGRTFSPTHVFRTVTPRNPSPEGRDAQLPEYAVNTESATHRDRIYAVFTQRIDPRGTRAARVFLQYSDDRGVTWSAPRIVDQGAPSYAEQFQQMVAVNRAGVVGVSWFDTRGRTDGLGFDQYFTASLDGGETFLPAARVSSVTSVPRNAATFRLTPHVYTQNDTLYIHGEPAVTRLDIGGDYMGLAADIDGVFHPVWTDAREGVYRIYTSSIRISDSPTTLAAKPEAHVRVLRASELSVSFETGTYDVTSDVLSIPMRFENTSTHPLYAPMNVRFDDNPAVQVWGNIGSPSPLFPIILGATNGKTGPGAEFDISELLGDAHVLPPGASTDVFVLRVRQPTPGDHLLGRMMTIVTAGVP